MKLSDIDLTQNRKLYHPYYKNIEWKKLKDGLFGLFKDNYPLFISPEIFDDNWQVMDEIDIKNLVLEIEKDYGIHLENCTGMDMTSYRSLRNYICQELQLIIDEKFENRN